MVPAGTDLFCSGAGSGSDGRLSAGPVSDAASVFVVAGATEDVVHALKLRAAKIAEAVKRPLCIVELLSI
jgi:hypothetical protein